MNEQLTVKNFGPIKDATVDFKRVTVFIGPTGGGKSTLAKLAAVFKGPNFFGAALEIRKKQFNNYSIAKYFTDDTCFHWLTDYQSYRIDKTLKQFELLLDKEKNIGVEFLEEGDNSSREEILKGIITEDEYNSLKQLVESYPGGRDALDAKWLKTFEQLEYLIQTNLKIPYPSYMPSNRALVPAVEYSWAGLLRDDIGLPKELLEFANEFSLSRKSIPELNISFLNANYIHQDGQDFIKIPESETLFRLYETASGIQSVTPMLVLLEHLSRQKEQAQSFIVEEPELNLYPTAQQGLMNWLVEKCTAGENDLTITTHSPYILSHLNLLLYAYQVAEKHPERKQEIAVIVPEASWINPKEFACYQVENGGVESLVNEELGLIDDNGLDNLSGDAADAFDNLIRLSKSVAVK